MSHAAELSAEEEQRRAIAEQRYIDYYSGADRDAAHTGTRTPDAGWIYGNGQPKSEVLRVFTDEEKAK